MSVLWADSVAAKILADNLARLGRERGMANWNQMAVKFREWARDKPFVEPLSVNTLRNIERGSNSPNAAKLKQLADFLQVPLYMLFIEDVPAETKTVAALNALVATFVNGDDNTRAAIRHMLSAFSSAGRPRPRVAAGGRR